MARDSEERDEKLHLLGFRSLLTSSAIVFLYLGWLAGRFISM
jgi:hypothetical protein